MMFNYYFNIGLIYSIVGFAAALVVYFILKKNMIGKFWGALVVGIIGSFLGGIIGFVFEDVINYLANINNAVNIFPPVISAFLILWIYSKVSEKQ